MTDDRTIEHPKIRPADDILLRCRDLDVTYGSVQVLFGVDFDVQRGEILALLGTNGAGKSTILKAVCGLVPARRGTIEFDGRDITGKATEDLTASGLVLMPGGRGIFPTLTVDENLRMATWLYRKEPDRAAAAREEALDLFPALGRRLRTAAGEMSGGEQQMLALAQAFMARPSLLMIDELSLGLAPVVVAGLLDVVRAIHKANTTIVVVEQSVNVALELADRAVFLEKGEVRFSGKATDLLERPDIVRSVFIAGAGAHSTNGDQPATTSAATRSRDQRTPPAPDAPVLLECKEVSKRFGGITALSGVNLQLRQGEILGLIGQNGAGKTTLFDCISGFLIPEEGRIVLRDVEIGDLPPHVRAEGGLGRLFQDARLFPSLTVQETVCVACERHLGSLSLAAEVVGAPVSVEAEIAVAEWSEELIELMGLSAFRDKQIGELSTGSRRIVELACILAAEPQVVLLDEPSAGIAQKETEALAPLLVRVQAHTGCSLLIIEHDMPLVSGISDRMMALELGQVIAQGSPDDVLQDPLVIESYLGTDSAAIQRSGTVKPSKRAPARKRAKARASSRSR